MKGSNVLEAPSGGSSSQVPGQGEPRPAPPRFRLGQAPLDRVRLGEALGTIEERVGGGQGGCVLMPGVEQVLLAESHRGLREALARADLVLAGGPELVRAARAVGRPLPEPHAGVEWLLPMVKRARERGWRVFLLAERPGTAERVAEVLRRQYGVDVVGVASPKVPAAPRGPVVLQLLKRIEAVRPHLVLVAVETPKQELLCQSMAAWLRSAVVLGAGAALTHLEDASRPVARGRALAGLGWLGGLLWVLTAPLRLLRRDLAFFRIIQRMGRGRRALPASPWR